MNTKFLAIGLVLAMQVVMQQTTQGQISEKELTSNLMSFNVKARTIDRQLDHEVQENPGTLTGYQKPENIGQLFYFKITGTTDGTIYGTDVYTDDSHLSTAAVHAGIIEPGETAIVRVTILPGRNSYRSTELNGIISNSYWRWPGSYLVDSIAEFEKVESPNEAPRWMSGIEGDIGQSFEYQVTGRTGGSVWGVDVYTDDSAIEAAAVHSGVLEVGETDTVKVTLLPGRTFYNGSERNGVTTASYGAFRRSYMIDRVGVSNALKGGEKIIFANDLLD